MIMYEGLLREIGLTGGETKVYLSLIKIGESTVGPIAREAGVSLSKIYEILDNLIEKGLVSHIVKNNTRHFLATDPERIIDYLEKKKAAITASEKKIQEILPLLRSKEEKNRQKIKATLYEGLGGIKSFYEQVLRDAKKGETILVMGLPRYASEKYEGYFLDWNKRRSRRRLKIRLIFDSDVRDLGEKRKKIRLTEVRYLPKELMTPAWILIYSKGVATIHLTKNPICTFIRDDEVVKSYKNFFDIFWGISRG